VSGGGAEPIGTIEVALSHTARLMGRDPKLAAEQATETLKVAPGGSARNAAAWTGITGQRARDPIYWVGATTP
jgi:hypothetical protein